MANFNKVILLGNLTRDPELSYLPSNTPVVEFGLAVNRRYRRQDGSNGEETLFIDCRAFGRAAEILNQYVKKGNQLFVEGRLQLDRWQDKAGNQRSKHRVTVEQFQFVGGRSGGGEFGEDGGSSGGSNYGGNDNGGGGGSSYDNAPPVNDMDDDIPF